MNNDKPIVIGIVAGETSGDHLGADFMKQMNELYFNIRWVGVGGPRMQEQGLESLIDMERLSLMGLFEVLKHLPDLFKAKKEILESFTINDIDCFVGIDAPDFNLRLSKQLKQEGVYCVQYVSPSVWAWREKRIFNIMQSTDMVMCLFPFELDIYRKHNHPAECVGHPLLDNMDANLISTPMLELRKNFIWQYKSIKEQFNNRKDVVSSMICVMPGSRKGEVKRILPEMLNSIELLIERDKNLSFVIPTTSPTLKVFINKIMSNHVKRSSSSINLDDYVSVVCDNNNKILSQETMAISDVILLASGTATLECLLLAKPMVVVYKLNFLTYKLAKKLVKTPYVSLPNIIAQREVVPELIQEKATAEAIAENVLRILEPKHHKEQKEQLQKLRYKLATQDRVYPAKAFVNHYLMSYNENGV